MPASITCPSGLSGIVRGLTAKEIEVLADKDLFKTGEYMDEFLRRCWVETTQPWVYPIEPQSKRPVWGKVLACDRFYAYVQMRRATWGDDYGLRVQCIAQGCREPFEISVPLTKLSVIELPEDSRLAFSDGNKLEAYLGREVRQGDPAKGENPDQEIIVTQGTRIVWKLPTGEDQWKLAKQRREQKRINPKAKTNPLVDALVMRTVEIEGVDGKSGLRRFYENSELRPVRELFDHMDRLDGGIETSTEVRCPYCETVWMFDLPFGPEFIFPDKTLTRRSS